MPAPLREKVINLETGHFTPVWEKWLTRTLEPVINQVVSVVSGGAAVDFSSIIFGSESRDDINTLEKLLYALLPGRDGDLIQRVQALEDSREVRPESSLVKRIEGLEGGQHVNPANGALIQRIAAFEDALFALAEPDTLKNKGITPWRAPPNGPDYFEIEADGTIRFYGNATVWDDIYFPMSSGKIGGANQPTWGAFQGNIFEYSFAVNDYIHLPSGEILHGYKEGSDIGIHVHIVTNGNEGVDTQVNYEVEYTIGDINEVMSAATIITSGNSTIASGTTDRTHKRIDIDTIIGTNILSMATIKMRFRRIARVGGTADPAVDPFVTMVGVHIEKDTIGSRTESAK